MRMILSLILTALAASVGAADSYTIDPNHTLPTFEVNHLGFTTQRGRFDKTEGKIRLDKERKTGAVDWTIDADSIDMGQAKWNDHLKSADFFNAAQYPTISFKSDKLVFQGNAPVSAEGVLTLLGVAKPLTVAIHRFTCGKNPLNQKELCAADIEASLKRSDFGMTKYLPGVGDEIKVFVPVEAYKD
jgi:polyisoprenoid-binding protein YceI